MHSGDRKIEALRTIPLLAGCSDEDLLLIAASGDAVPVSAGDMLRASGSEHPSFFLILSGSAVLGIDAVLTRGDTDGAIGLLGGEDDSDELRMLTDGRVLVIGRREFAALIWRVPAFAKAIAQDLSQRLRRQHARNHGRSDDDIARSA